MSLFYSPDIEKTLALNEEESAHAIRVLRLHTDDLITIIDGKGNFFSAKITDAHPKHCGVCSLEKYADRNIRNYHIHIAIAPTKNMDRMEWFAEKVTEIGIDAITPIFCRFSERKVIKTDRLQKILVSAMKQSKQAFLPQLNEPISFDEFMKQNLAGQKFIAHCYEGQEKQALATTCKKGNDIVVLIGPEGDFSEEEVTKALQKGFVPVSLGETRLRTETAAIVACHTVHVINAFQ